MKASGEAAASRQGRTKTKGCVPRGNLARRREARQDEAKRVLTLHLYLFTALRISTSAETVCSKSVALCLQRRMPTIA